MSVKNKDPFANISDEDRATMDQFHRLHVNANLRTQLVAMALFVIPILVRHFYPEPWTVWGTAAAICWPVGLFVGGIVA